LIYFVMQRYGGGYADAGTKAYGKEKQYSTCSLTPAGDGKCNGEWADPAPGYRQSDVFGSCRPVGGPCRRKHEGVDVETPIGTPIKASNGGTVSFIGTMGGYGITIDIKHCDGKSTRYAHLSKTLVKRGQTVSQNQVVAQSGNTGGSTGPHLHFEVRDANGSALNPKNFVKRFR
jgi:murein DD-endopeptidase MepM/ murein hydrolase activator NlpD